MNNANNTYKSIRFVCAIIISFLILQAKAQVKIPTFILNEEEYEVMPFDENGTPRWREATEGCVNKQAYGHSDWFLPDIEQLRSMYAHQNAIGGFTDNWYWSSTQNNQYSSVVINFKNGQSFPEGNASRAVKCRYIRKTGGTQKTHNDYSWIYGEWIGKYGYYSHTIWTESYMVVTITPKRLVISDQGEQVYDGGYVIKDDLIEYIPYHNDLGWIGSDEWGFLEIMHDSQQLGSGYNRVLSKSKSYNYSSQAQQGKNRETPNDAKITIKSDGCEIAIDGKSVGKDQWRGNLERGNHIIRVIKAGYEPYEENITVVGGRNSSYDINPKHLKKHVLNISCNVENCMVNTNGQSMDIGPKKSLALELEMITTHTLCFEAPNHVPITVYFYILEDQVVYQGTAGLNSYDGEQSSVVKANSNELEIYLKKLNKRLYNGNETRYKQRPRYNGPIMGRDKSRINGFSIGSETAWCNEYYGASRIMFTWSLGLSTMRENEAIPVIYYEGTEYKTPVDYFGFGIGWQVFRGTGLRVTPQIEAAACSLLYNPYIMLGAKVNVSYPLTDSFVIGMSPIIGLYAIEYLENNPFFARIHCFGVSLNLGWQKKINNQ